MGRIGVKILLDECPELNFLILLLFFLYFVFKAFELLEVVQSDKLILKDLIFKCYALALLLIDRSIYAE